MPDLKKRWMMNEIPQGDAGGHAPVTEGDERDLGEVQFRQAKNIDPVREDGAYAKRRPILQAVTRDTGMTGYRIVNQAYVRGVRIGPSLRDYLLVQHDGENEVDLRYREYDPTDQTYYDATDWQSWKTPTQYTEENGYIPRCGRGQWTVDREFVRQANGPYARNPSTGTGGSNPTICGDFYRSNATPYWNGLYADPNTPANAGGRISITGPKQIPEKVWPGHSAITLEIYSVIGITGNADSWHRTGKCYYGTYNFIVVPIDVFGEEGPPIITQVYNLPDEYTIAGIGTRKVRGATIAGRLQVTTATPRPNIKGYRLYVGYKNPIPESRLWQESVGGPENIGFGLPSAPADVPICRVIDFDLTGRQFDNIVGTWPSRFGTTTTGLQSAQMNVQIGGPVDQNGWVYAKRNGDYLEFDNSYSDGGDVVTWWPYMFERPREFTNDFDKCHIEFHGFAGTSRIFDWLQDGGEGGTPRLLLEDPTGGGTVWPPSWTDGTRARVRFVHPWQPTGVSNEYQVSFWITDLHAIANQSAPLTWPSDAKATYDAEYPFFTLQAINKDGDFRVASGPCWINNVYRDNEVYCTTYNVDTPELSRFRLPPLVVDGQVSGVAFFDRTRFLIMTRNKGYEAEYYQIEGTWFTRLTGREFDIGHAIEAEYMFSDGESVYGYDPDQGFWVFGPDLSRLHPSLSPYGSPVPILNKLQKAALGADFRGGTALQHLGITRLRDRLILSVPSFGASGSHPVGTKNNVKINDVSASGHYWLTYYFEKRFWSYDYYDATTIAMLDPVGGPGRTLLFHDQSNWYVLNDVDSTEQDYNSKSIQFYLELMVQSPRLPFAIKMMRLLLFIRKLQTNACSVTIAVTPYKKGVAGTAATLTGQTDGTKWWRGVNREADLFRIEIKDTGSGTTAIQGIEALFRDFGRSA